MRSAHSSCLFFQLLLLGDAFSYSKVIDLTWEYDANTLYWPGVARFSFTKVTEGEERGFWYAMKEFCTGEHGGTHLDAPYHFNKEGWKVAEIPVDRLVGKGTTIDLADESEHSGKELKKLEVSHLENWESVNGPFEPGSILLVDFGRAKYWRENAFKYLESDDRQTFNTPGLSDEAARWIASSGKFYGIGLDAPSVDPGNSTTMMVHRILAKEQIFNLENVNLTKKLPAKNFTIIVAPMKIADGTGAPVRIFAIVNSVL
ncbi:kynurenine formamidase-like [Cylas formicarius]|uniref:kynurenine formamidase-like n=1 Tax=Cylas formicarius TaxID=197179 RepID=UPI002958B8E9|nr:kynurenine formamidase-like [Cylas formicarius]